jgi:hypothetical protein
VGKAVKTRYIQQPTEKGWQAVSFFKGREGNGFEIWIMDEQDKLLGQMKSPVAYGAVEDVDGDQAPEIVIRQYLENKREPLKVYRFTASCGYHLDETIQSWFQ